MEVIVTQICINNDYKNKKGKSLALTTGTEKGFRDFLRNKQALATDCFRPFWMPSKRKIDKIEMVLL